MVVVVVVVVVVVNGALNSGAEIDKQKVPKCQLAKTGTKGGAKNVFPRRDKHLTIRDDKVYQVLHIIIYS